jgi:molybdenum cofactor cytidylyltransferase
VTAGLVLAAGAGTRYGSEPKLLADISGRPVLQHAIDAMTPLPSLDRVVVVLGAHAQRLLAEIRFGRAEPIVCADWQDGQSASLRCGVDALVAAEKIVVILGDQPLINPRIVQRFVGAPAGSRATYRGEPGHPVVLGPEHTAAIRELTGDRGARDILDGPLIESAEMGVPRDLDTSEDLRELRREAGRVERTGH